MREAIINAIVHNDYTYELAPKFEFFDDRFEITSYGGLPEGMTKEEFFEGVSIPKSKEIMRIFRDMELVEQLGSGVPRILQSYGKECFYFSENYTRISLPSAKKVNRSKSSNEGLNEGLSEGLKSLLSVINENPGIQAKETPEFLKNRPIKTIERQIAQLIELGLVERRGSRKSGGYWIITQNSEK